VSRGIALLILDLGARRGWVVSTMLRPLYPRERPGTHCTGGWVGLRAGLDVLEKSRSHWDSIPEILIFINIIHERRWISMSNSTKLKYTKRV
jgi:hypothetical protein